MKKRSIGKIIAIVIAIIIAIFVVFAGFVYISLNSAVGKVTKLDEKGAFYELEYKGDYYSNPSVKLARKLIRGAGCSEFRTWNEGGDVLTCRNYDLPHVNEKGEATGLNMVVKLYPEGKYSSINMVDAAWASLFGFDYYEGAPDSKTHMPLGLAPFMCMDGMNEKGLTASILYLDTKKNEAATDQKDAGKETVTINELLRYTLDNCANVNEAAEYAKNFNMHGLMGYDYHLMLTDADGRSAVLEWRDNKLTVTDTDACTNFYVAYDDAEDCYEDGKLKEKFEKVSSTRDYHYGYGHGYARFAKIVSALEEHRLIARLKILSNGDIVDYATEMTDDEAKNILASVTQDYDGSSMTSFTQYSVIYNNTDRTLKVWIMKNFDKTYEFSL